jgi:hypothetical protein
MKHLINLLTVMFLFSGLSMAKEGKYIDDIFLKPEYLFAHQPIEIEFKGLSATMLSIRQKDGIGFYLINGKNIEYGAGMSGIDNIESVFFPEKNIVIIIASTIENGTYGKKGKTYVIYPISLFAERGIEFLVEEKGRMDWMNCFEGTYSDGTTSTCPYKDVAGVKKGIKEMRKAAGLEK